MGKPGYRPWSHAEEDHLEEWVAQHLELTWDERAEEYSQTVCPRSSESLRSKLRQIKRNIRRRRALHLRHRQRHRDVMARVVGRQQQTALAPPRSGPRPRYVSSRQTYDRLHGLPLSQGHPTNRKALPIHENPASRLLDEFHGVQRPGSNKRIDVTPHSHIDAVVKRPGWSSQLSQRSPQATNLLWRVVCRLASRRRR